MTAGNADRNLLLGLLALQNNFIDREALLLAFSVWIADKTRPIGQVLAERRLLAADERALLEALVAKHLEKFGDDPRKSLASLSSIGSVRQALSEFGDPEIEASLPHVSAVRPDRHEDSVRAVPLTIVGDSTSAGSRFLILRPHAKGGLGQVSLARDTELNRDVALKEIQVQFAFDQRFRSRFVFEAEVTGGLEHPGIVPVYGLGHTSDGRPFYAMRFIKGDSLKDAIRRFHEAEKQPGRDPGQSTLELRELLGRFIDVCDAVAYAHSRGVLHRDLKPGNIMLGKYGETLVVDWGLAKALDEGEPLSEPEPESQPERAELPLRPLSGSALEATLAGSAVGTPAYMSPEQIDSRMGKLGVRSDVYCLGATLYHLLTGHPPCEADNAGEVYRKIQAGEIPHPRSLNPRLAPALEAVCLKAIATRPQARYDCARALAQDVERWMADEPVSAWKEPIFATLRRWAKRHRAIALALCLCLMTAVGFLIFSNIVVTRAQSETAAALHRVTQEQERTKEALARADENFRRARKTVDDYFTTVSEEVLLDEPGMQSLRENLLRRALEYHSEFLTQRNGDADVEAELAGSHERCGAIASLNGRYKEAESHYLIALETFQSLLSRHPDRFEYRRAIASSLQKLASLIARQGSRHDEAIRIHRQAIDAYEQLVRDQPSGVDHRRGLAASLIGLGTELNHRRGTRDEVARVMGRARDLMEQLALAQPDLLRNQIDLATLHHDLYNVFVGNLNRQNEALSSSQDALNVYEALSKRVPHSPRFRHSLGVIRSSRARIYHRMGRLPDSIRESEQSRLILSDVVQANPQMAEYRADLATSCAQLGWALTNCGEHRRALDPLREACDAFDRYLAGNPGNLVIQSQYLVALNARGAALGRLRLHDEAVSCHRRAVSVAASLNKRDPRDKFNRGNLMSSLMNLAIALTLADRHEEAVATYRDHRTASRNEFGDIDVFHGGIGEVNEQLAEAYSLREIGRIEQAERMVSGLRAKGGKDPENLYYFARNDARGAALLANDGGNSVAIDDLKSRAMGCLLRLKFQPSELRDLQLDPAFDSIRDRIDFQLLMQDAAFPPDPFVR